MKNQLFIIPASTWTALDRHEVEATAEAMREFGIYRLPYPRIDLWLDARVAVHSRYRSDRGGYLDQLIHAGAFKRLPDPEGGADLFVCNMGIADNCVMEVRNLSLERNDFTKHFRITAPNKWCRAPTTSTSYEPATDGEWEMYLNVIIVLLNTRNAVKSTTRDKLASLGIGRKSGRHAHEYVTTIALPRERDMAKAEGPGEPTGRHVAPHLRRGHPRDQHFGPNRAFVKRVWIEPVFVNADKGWVSQRERYNVSLGAPPPLTTKESTS